MSRMKKGEWLRHFEAGKDFCKGLLVELPRVGLGLTYICGSASPQKQLEQVHMDDNKMSPNSGCVHVSDPLSRPQNSKGSGIAYAQKWPIRQWNFSNGSNNEELASERALVCISNKALKKQKPSVLSRK